MPLKLVKGSNQIVLKVQNVQGGWAFAARLLDNAALGKQLNTAAANGNLDKIQMLIEHVEYLYRSPVQKHLLLIHV